MASETADAANQKLLNVDIVVKLAQLTIVFVPTPYCTKATY